MKVDGPDRVNAGAVARTGRAGAARPGDFSRRLGKAEDPGVSASVPGTLPLGSVAALIAVQGVDDEGAARRPQALRERAEDLLGRLEELRDGLLAGAIPKHRLEELVARLGERRAVTTDPRLAELIDEIELRASVELAKLSML